MRTEQEIHYRIIQLMHEIETTRGAQGAAKFRKQAKPMIKALEWVLELKDGE